MLTHPLAERLRALGMAAMADTFLEMQNSSAAADLTREDWLGLLLDREVTARDNKRLSRRLSRQLRRLLDIGVIKRVTGTYRYYLTKAGRAAAAAAGRLTESVIIPAMI
jgi:hypothetical protein